MPRPPHRRVVRLGVGAIAIATTWLGFAYAVVPRLIRAAYEGRSLQALNQLISGQADHPVEEYLAAWTGLAWRLTVGFVIAAILVAVMVRCRHTIAAWTARAVLGPTDHALGAGGMLALALSVGAATGLMEAVGAVVHQMLVPKPNWMYRPDVLWAAPVVNGAVMFLVTAPLALLLGLLRRRMPVRPLAFGLVAVGVYAALRGWGVGLLPYAAALLGAGLASLTVRRLEQAHNARWRLAPAGLGLLVAGLAIGIPLTEWVAESLALARAPAPRANKPNVLLLILDTVRAPELSLYGYPLETSPRLAEAAERGVVFGRAVAPSTWTLPSHASLFTGEPPTRLAADWDVRFDDDVPTLSEALADAGYVTAGFVANYHYTGSATGLARGFHHYADHRYTVEYALRNSYIGRKLDHWRRRMTSDRQLLDRLDATDINAMLLNWLSHRGDRPFFAFVNYFDAHDPYMPPHAPDEWADARPPLYHVTKAPGTYTEAELRELQRAYDAAIRYLDARVGALLDTLDAIGLTDSTIVVITSDHGEKFGENDTRLVLHGNSLYFAALHVPLIVLVPGMTRGARWVESPVSLTDLAATIVDLTGVSGRLPGSSLVGLWAPNGAGEPRQVRPAVSAVRPYRNPMPWEPIAHGSLTSWISGHLHYIRSQDGSEELYDIVADPWEREDLARGPDAVATVGLDAMLDSLRALDSVPQR